MIAAFGPSASPPVPATITSMAVVDPLLVVPADDDLRYYRQVTRALFQGSAHPALLLELALIIIRYLDWIGPAGQRTTSGHAFVQADSNRAAPKCWPPRQPLVADDPATWSLFNSLPMEEIKGVTPVSQC